MMLSSTNWPLLENLYWVSSRGLPKEWLWAESWSDRQERITGFDQKRISDAFVWVFGCNGLGRTAAEFVVRKGYRGVGICDPDIVEISNLHRTLWRQEAVGEFKAVQAVRELMAIAPAPMELLGFVGKLQEIFNTDLMNGVSACLVGVDNDEARAFAARELRQLGIPAVFYALSTDTFTYEVFVQESGGPCWACIHPDRYDLALAGAIHNSCPKVPSIADPSLIAAGLTCFALDSLLMGRSRAWNYRQGHLHGELPEMIRVFARRADCPVCSTG